MVVIKSALSNSNIIDLILLWQFKVLLNDKFSGQNVEIENDKFDKVFIFK